MRQFPIFFNQSLAFEEFLTQLRKNESFCPRLSLSLEREESTENKLSFCEALGENTSTFSLSIDALLDEEFSTLFLEVLEKNTTLTDLLYHESKFSKESNKVIHTILNRNRKLALEKEIHPIKIEYDHSDLGLAFTAAAFGNLNLLYSILEDDPDVIKEVDNSYDSLLHKASHYGSVDCAKLLLSKGADVNYNPFGHMKQETGTPLMQAVREYHVVVVQLLLKAGANVHLRGYGFTPLHYARTVAIAKLLIEHKADINASGEHDYRKCSKGTSVLISTAKKASVPLLQFLIDQGAADSHATDSDGESVFHRLLGHLYSREFQEKCCLLLRIGCNPLLQNNRYLTPLALAKSMGSPNTPVMQDIIRDYVHITQACKPLKKAYIHSLFAQAVPARQSFFSCLPVELIEKIATFTAKSSSIDEETQRALFKKNF